MKPFGLSLLRRDCRLSHRALRRDVSRRDVSSNVHDRSMEAAMTGAFVIGPLAGLVAVIVTIIYGLRRR